MHLNELWSNGSYASLSFCIDLGHPKQEHKLFLMTSNYEQVSYFDCARKLHPTIVIWDSPKLQYTMIIYNFFK